MWKYGGGGEALSVWVGGVVVMGEMGELGSEVVALVIIDYLNEAIIVYLTQYVT